MERSEILSEVAASGLGPNSVNVTEILAHFASDIRSGNRTVPDFVRAVSL